MLIIPMFREIYYGRIESSRLANLKPAWAMWELV